MEIRTSNASDVGTPATSNAIATVCAGGSSIDPEVVDAMVGRKASSPVAGLTDRERDVMALAATGQHNKEIARELGISYRTVEIHRGRLMHKMGAASLVELAEMARICKLGGPAHGIGRPQA